MMRKAEVCSRVVVGDIADEAVEKFFVMREFPIFHVLADDVAEETTKILMAWKAQERPRVREHADKMTEEPDGGDGVDLILHAHERVIEPPARAELDL